MSNLSSRLFGRTRKILEKAARSFLFLIFKCKYPGTKFIRVGRLPTFYSQNSQDLFLSGLLFSQTDNNPDRKNIFLDIGCNHPEHFSNSLYFEKYLGFQTIAVDPLKEFEPLWRDKRPEATFIQCALGKQPGEMEMFVPQDTMFASFHRNNIQQDTENISTRHVEVKQLSDLLSGMNLTKILLCSIDVEGAECEVLEGFDFSKCFIGCFCIENNSSSPFGSDELRKILLRNSYIFYCRLSFQDDVFIHNSYLGRVL